MPKARPRYRKRLRLQLAGDEPTPRDADGSVHQVAWSEFIAERAPRVVLRFAMISGRAECVRVEIGARFDDPEEPGPVPLRSEDLRNIALSEMIADSRADRREALAHLAIGAHAFNLKQILARADELEATDPASADALREWARSGPATLEGAAAASLPEAAVGRTRGWSPVAVAEVYRDAWAQGKDPTAAVKNHFGLSRGGASKRVWKVRKLGLLPPTAAGKANAGPLEPPRTRPGRGKK